MEASPIWEKNMETKKEIRKHFLSVRASLMPKEREEKSRMITGKVISHPLFKQSETICCYLDYKSEVHTRGIIEAAWNLGKRVAAPRIENGEMEFYYMDDFLHLQTNVYGIDEPTSKERVDCKDALVILPGVAFDRVCHRIGYGGGYYDRYLSLHPTYRRMAISFAVQCADEIPHEMHDLKPEIIITEGENYGTEF